MAPRICNTYRWMALALLTAWWPPGCCAGSLDYDYAKNLEGREDDPLEAEPDKVCEICRCFNESSTALLLDCHSSNLEGVPAWLNEMEDTNYTIFLDLSYNAIEEVMSFPNLDAWGLDLSHNSLMRIGDAAFARVSSSLLQLDLSHNQLRTTGLSKDSFSGTVNGSDKTFRLLELSLAHNQLHSLQPDLFRHLNCLTDLDLSGNPLAAMNQETAEAVGSLATLQSLTLRSTGLKTLPDGLLTGLTQLTSLYLAGNQFSQVDPQINLVTSLESLNLDDNYLQRLDEQSFSGLELLRNLSVCNNHGLASIEKGTFEKLTKLQQLRISDNPELTWISPDAWPTRQLQQFQLEELCLANNKLSYLPSMLLPDFSDWQTIRVIDIQGNPWMCDCHNEWMINTLLPLIHKNTPELTQEVTCGGPAGSVLQHEQLLVIHDLTPSSDLPCDPKPFNLWERTPDNPSMSREEESNRNGISLSVSLLCIAAIAATMGLVGALHLQKRRSKGGQVKRPGGYIMAGSVRPQADPAADEQEQSQTEGAANSGYVNDVEDGESFENQEHETSVVGDRNDVLQHPFGRPI